MIITKEELLRYGREIFIKAGVCQQDAQTVIEELVEANLYGVDSHGVIRIPQYLEEIENGNIVPNTKVEVVKETATTAVIDGNHNFGQVVGRKMVSVLAEKAKKNMLSCGVCLHSYHAGRIGAWVEGLAKEGLIGLCAVAAYHPGPLAPWGASEPRLGTNPIAFAAPRKDGKPVFLDFSTTVVAEGKVRNYLQQGKPVPLGWIRDAQGNDTTDPMDFYKEPQGTMLPMGGLTGGAKGSALSIMTDILSIALADTDYWTCLSKNEPPESESGIFLLAINPDGFFGRDAFEAQCAKHAEFFKSAKPLPGVDEVLLPGEFEYSFEKRRSVSGIELPDATWFGLVRIAQSLNCEWSREIDTPPEENAFLRYR